MKAALISKTFLLALGLGLLGTAGAGETWTKLADAPTDLAGREMPPGMDGAWCWVPELKGFLLYGGYSPRLTNEGWLYDPAKNEMRLLWPDDSLRCDAKTKKWRVLMPRDIIWSLERPGPARGRAAVYSPATRKVYLFGGHPGGAKSRAWFGGTQLGTWELDPGTMKFRHLGDSGPGGFVKAVYDAVNKLIVVAPQKSGKKTVTWVFSPAAGKWEARSPAGSPRPGPFPGFAYDSKARKCVYYTEYGETWTYDAARNEWKDAQPAKGPPPRRHAGMCFDPQRGATVLHGGVHHLKKGGKPWAGWGASSGAFLRHRGNSAWYNDTWAYDALKNEWRKLRTAASTPADAPVSDMLAYDPDRATVTLYAPSAGIWALGGKRPGKAGLRVVVPPEVLAVQKKLAAARPPADPRVRAWQKALREMPDDSWLDSKRRKPTQGCINFTYDPANRCLIWIGGCCGAVFGCYEDYGYNNQIVMLDMDAGRWFQRRSNHLWGPPGAGYLKHRHANGCGRGFCFDSRRRAVWTTGGVSSLGFPGTHNIQTYDVGADRYGPAGSRAVKVQSGLVYDSKNDLVVVVTSRGKTLTYDPKTAKWTERAGAPPKGASYTNVAYDPQVGVVVVALCPAGWKLGSPLPKKGWDKDRSKASMRAFAFDAAAGRWRDLAPKNSEKVFRCTLPGIAYDSRNRAVIMVEHEYSYQGYGRPAKPRQVWILDLAANAWKRGKNITIPPLNMGSMTYDANHNVVILGGSSHLIFYRYKGGCPKDAFAAGSRK